MQYERPISIIQDQDILDEIPLEDTRNFCFIAHVDHGVSCINHFSFFNYNENTQEEKIHKQKEIKFSISCARTNR